MEEGIEIWIMEFVHAYVRKKPSKTTTKLTILESPDNGERKSQLKRSTECKHCVCYSIPNPSGLFEQRLRTGVSISLSMMRGGRCATALCQAVHDTRLTVRSTGTIDAVFITVSLLPSV